MNRHYKIACSTQNLKEVRDFVNQSLDSYGLGDVEKNLLVLAIDEVCANLIIHSNGSDTEKFIEISIHGQDQDIIFEITDSGLAFDPNLYTEPDLQTLVKEKKKGGVGLMLVKKVIDSIELIKKDTTTIYRLHKRTTAASF
ncbi:MAG: ATP-binding protein [Cytophagaceae bacterium]